MRLLQNNSFVSQYSVTRQVGAGSWVKGKWTDSGTTATLIIKASTQKLTPKETEMLPEAYRTRRSYRIYTETELFPVDVPNSKNSDSISIDGAIYDIVDVERWDKMIPHFKAIAARRENIPL
jgi:hypothetical protein